MNVMKNQIDDWTVAYKNEQDKKGMTFPSEYVIRIFKGSYPKCNLCTFGGGYEQKSILDISCGAGRDLIIFDQVGFEKIAATEITKGIVDQCKENLHQLGIDADVRVGNNRNLPFDDGSFDYLLSWNVCYYFDDVKDFSAHVKEYARVCKSGGVLVFSIPKPQCFIYENGIDKGNGLVEITSDPFSIRNGVELKCFKNEKEIEMEFSPFFEDFCFGSIEDDCFGLNYSWFIGYCRRK